MPVKTWGQIIAAIEATRQAKLDERTRQLIAELYVHCGNPVAELYAHFVNPEVSGEVAKADVGKVVNIAAFHRDNQK